MTGLSPPSSPARPDVVSRELARNRLGVPAVVFFVMSAAAPLTVVGGVVPTGFAVTGLTGIPVAFLVIGVVLAVFSVGFVAMAREVDNAGVFYAYVARGLGRPLGVGAAGVALLAYNGLQVALYGAIGAAVIPLVQQWFGLTVAWWAIALAAWLLVAMLGLLKVDVNGGVLAVLLLAEVAVIVVFSVADLHHPAGGTVTVATLDPANLIGPGVGAALALGVLGFVGFESGPVYSEESRNRLRTVPVATFASLAIIAGLYAFGSWAFTVAVGPERIVAASQEQGPQILFTLAADHLGPVAADVGRALFATSIIAAMISFHNTAARYFFALGREGVVAAKLGDTAGSGAPRVGSLLQSGLGVAVIAVYGFAGWDPLVHLFFWGGTGGGLGVLLLTTVTALAVIVFFARHRWAAGGAWQRLVAPGVAAVLLLGVFALALVNFDTLLGVTPDSPVRWAIPGAYLAAALLGIGWALLLRQFRPNIYARIGLGAKATTSILGLTVPQPHGRHATDAPIYPEVTR